MKQGDTVQFWCRGAKQMVSAVIREGPKHRALGRTVGSWCSREKYYAERILVDFTVNGQRHVAWIQSSRAKNIMRIQATNGYCSGRVYESIAEYAEGMLESNEAGRVEAAAETAQNNSNAIGRLLQLLFDKDVITLSDIPRVLQSYLTNDDTLEVIE